MFTFEIRNHGTFKGFYYSAVEAIENLAEGDYIPNAFGDVWFFREGNKIFKITNDTISLVKDLGE